jgi:hypothetical protein
MRIAEGLAKGAAGCCAIATASAAQINPKRKKPFAKAMALLLPDQSSPTTRLVAADRDRNLPMRQRSYGFVGALARAFV